MKFNDSLIEELPSLISMEEKRSYLYSEEKTWPESDDYELILQKDSAFELGGRGFESVNYTLVTDRDDFVSGDEVLVCGQELQEISGDISYARIVLVRVKDDEKWNSDSEEVYQMLSNIDFVKYHIFPKGYMFRSSGQNCREQVRVGKKELTLGMTFENIGNTIISHYKKDSDVVAVKVIFVTGNRADYAGLANAAVKARDIRRSLSIINKNMPTECSTCGIKEICNEVEGLKELHFGKKKTKNRQQVII